MLPIVTEKQMKARQTFWPSASGNVWVPYHFILISEMIRH